MDAGAPNFIPFREGQETLPIEALKELENIPDILCLFDIHDRLCYPAALIRGIMQLGTIHEFIHYFLGTERTCRTSLSRFNPARITLPVFHTDRYDRSRIGGTLPSRLFGNFLFNLFDQFLNLWFLDLCIGELADAHTSFLQGQGDTEFEAELSLQARSAGWNG